VNPPRKREDSIIRLIRELGERPAMNGGFKRLAQQQDEQLEELKHLKSRIDPIESFVKSWQSSQKWLFRCLGAIFAGVAIELIVQLVAHLQVGLK
jgi:hypothetical protein